MIRYHQTSLEKKFVHCSFSLSHPQATAILACFCPVTMRCPIHSHVDLCMLFKKHRGKLAKFNQMPNISTLSNQKRKGTIRMRRFCSSYA